MLCRKTASVFLALICVFFVSSRFCHAGKDTLAIFSFRPTNIEAMGYNGDILYALISALGMEGSVELMPRRAMEETLFQAGLTQSDNPDAALKGGKALGANFVLFGQVTKKGANILSTLRLMDIQGRRVIKTWSLNFTGRESILDRIPVFAKELIQVIEAKDNAGASQAVEQASYKIDGFSAKSKGKTVVLTWKFNPADPISEFNIYRSENENGPYQLIGKTNRNIYEDSTIQKGRNYYYRIGLLLHTGNEQKSPFLAEIRNAGEKIPYPPLIISSRGFVRRVGIKFVPALENKQERFKIKDYEVYRKKPSGSGWKMISRIDARKKSKYEISYEIEDVNQLEDGTTYVYAISSVDSKHRVSPKSDRFSVKTIERPVLNVARDNLLRKVMFSWTPLQNVKGYYLYRKPPKGSWEKTGTIRNAGEALYTDDENLDDGKEYDYYLTAYDEKGETGPSKAVRAKTKDLPPYPENIRVKSGLVKSVWISWAPIDDPDIGGYAIYRGESPEGLERITKVRGNRSLSYLDRGTGFQSLDDGKNYYYVVVSYNLFDAEGPVPPAVMATTKPRPVRVAGITANADRNNIVVRWNSNPEPDIAKYVIYRNRNDGFWSKTNELPANQTEYRDFDLKPESTYRYRIIAIDKDDLKSDPVESEAVFSPIPKK